MNQTDPRQEALANLDRYEILLCSWHSIEEIADELKHWQNALICKLWFDRLSEQEKNQLFDKAAR